MIIADYVTVKSNDIFLLHIHIYSIHSRVRGVVRRASTQRNVYSDKDILYKSFIYGSGAQVNVYSTYDCNVLHTMTPTYDRCI